MKRRLLYLFVAVMSLTMYASVQAMNEDYVQIRNIVEKINREYGMEFGIPSGVDVNGLTKDAKVSKITSEVLQEFERELRGIAMERIEKEGA